MTILIIIRSIVSILRMLPRGPGAPSPARGHAETYLEARVLAKLVIPNHQVRLILSKSSSSTVNNDYCRFPCRYPYAARQVMR